MQKSVPLTKTKNLSLQEIPFLNPQFKLLSGMQEIIEK
jgi:hypothetical protein